MAKRITVSIPDALADRLESFKESFNVSQVCAEALERKVSAMEEMKAAEGSVIERLRASKKRSVEGRTDLGNEAGQRWAKEDAETEELEALERYDTRWIGAGRPDHSWGHCLLAWLDEQTGMEKYPDMEEVPVFFACWSSDGKDHSTEEWFVTGFVEGALEVWEEVKDKVREAPPSTGEEYTYTVRSRGQSSGTRFTAKDEAQAIEAGRAYAREEYGPALGRAKPELIVYGPDGEEVHRETVEKK